MIRLFCLPLLALLSAPLAWAGDAPGAPVGLNLAPITDWSTQQPFIDVMKTARPWIVHRAGQWGGAGEAELIEGGYLDQYGWPRRLPRELGTVGTLILTDIPAEARSLAGTYRLRFEGDGIVEVGGIARNVRYARGDVLFDYTPGPGPVEIRIQRSNPEDYVRGITVVKEDHRAAFEAGQIFNPDWIALIDDFALYRFMDWMATNNARVSDWQDRPLPPDYTYARNGVPLEIMIALLRETGADGWFTLPHLATDGYARNFAALMDDALPEGQTLYAEYSNEVWNWQFEQTAWANAQGEARWGQPDTGPQFYGMRAAQLAAILSEVFDASEGGAALKNVISSQTGWLGLEELILEAPLWVAEETSPGNPPWIYFDAYAVTGYFGGILGVEERAPMVRGWIEESRAAAEADAEAQGLSGEARAAYVEAHRYDAAHARAGAELRDGSVSGDALDTVSDLMTRVLPYHAAIAEGYGLEMVIYEGGSHVVGIGPMVDDDALTDFFMAFNYTPEMAALYAQLLEGWAALGGGAFVAYNDVYAPSKWGSWGSRRWLSDDNPRWRALADRAAE
ncbi:hypothetical protein [Roseovarius faecimaris]|uniref:hypothetical protein n=1 Tax=Roseovarius faecimaris TaxID=2494550 RepID=UPI0018E01BAF|nr:hypothetical protein [Roseovarius faecimaris]